MAAKCARVPCGVVAGFWTARCSASKFDDAASACDRDLMMRTAGMSISGARRAQTSPGLPADAHDAGFWGAKMGGTTARCTNSRCPHLAQPLNMILHDTIWYYAVQHDTAWYHTMLYDIRWYYMILCYTILCYILCYTIVYRIGLLISFRLYDIV